MRIAFFSWRDLAHPQAGGSEVVVDHLASGLQQRGHEVVLLSGGPVAERPYRVLSTGGTYAQYLRAPIEYWRRVRPVDVIVDVENGIPFFAPLWQSAPVVCLIHHVHTDQWGMQFPGPVAGVGRWLEGSLMPRVYRAVQFVAVSPSTRDELVTLGVDDRRVTTIEMGCEPVAAAGPRSSTPRFLVLGRLVPHKRVEIALRAWEHVQPALGGTLVVAGDGPELSRLRDGSPPGVDFTGYVSAERKAQELGAAWLLVHPAHHEGWGTVVMEAASVGLPTLAFDVPGVRDSIVDGVTGTLVADERAFVDAWLRLGADPGALHRLGEGARRRASTFTWERAIERFESTLVAAAADPT